MTKNIVAEGVDAIEVIVDSQCASNNITRFLTQNGFKTIDCTQKDDCIYIRASK
jgi:TusA-related sulfurtransferase